MTPPKYLSTPRLELKAATLSVKMSQLRKRGLELNDKTSITESFWTESQVVIGYINNKSKRFKVISENRLQLIRDNPNTEEWHCVDTNSNPVDHASRSLDVTNANKVQGWYNGPVFLQQSAETWSLEKNIYQILNESDPEITREVKVNVTRTFSNSVLTWLGKRISYWTRSKRIIGIDLKYGQILTQNLSPP